MRSAKRGKRFSGTVEIAAVTADGVRIVIDGRERQMPFEGFPWFEHATIAQIMNVEYVSADHLWWPDLDVELHVESIDHPERFPLIWRPDRVPAKLLARKQQPSSTKRARKTIAKGLRTRTASTRA